MNIKEILKTVYQYAPDCFRPGYQTYWKYRKLIADTEFLSKKELTAFQLKELQKIVRYAWETIPGYREHWQKGGFSPDQLKTTDDIRRIPMISKQEIMKDVKKFSNLEYKASHECTTGGSTGNPFHFFANTDDEFVERAFIVDMWKRVFPQAARLTRSAVLRGNQVHNAKGIQRSMNLVYFSSYDMDLEHVKNYAEEIDRFAPETIQAYPSALVQMVQLMNANGIKLKQPIAALLLGSEPLQPWQKDLLTGYFHAPVSHWYGHTEKVILAGNCEKSEAFHVYPQYGYTEIIKEDGSSAQEGEVGELVGTGFWNFATPLIRYRTQDFVELGADRCPLCGRNYQLLNRIEGRSQDFVIDDRNIAVNLTSLIFAQHFQAFSRIQRMQLEQFNSGQIIVKVVANSDFTEDDSKEIVRVISEATGGHIAAEVRKVDSIPLTIRGKNKFLIQHLDLRS